MQDAAVPALDLTQAVLGPGLAVFSRFARVVEPSGDSMSVRTAIALINQVRSEALTEQQDEFDGDTRWAVQWFEEYGFVEGPYARAEVLFTGTDTSFDGLRRAGVIDSRPSKVWLVRPDDLPDNWDPAADSRVPVWEVTMHLVRTLDRGGEDAAARLLARIGGIRDAARDLAYRLADICERRRWAREALAFNGLIVSWPEIARRAASIQETLL
jgi:putative DNA methylase